MRAVILAGGEGTRLRPLTCSLPKPMVPVLNRPFLEHLLTQLARHQVTEAVLALCYMPHRIQAHFGDGRAWGLRLLYEVEERPMGTAGAVKRVEPYLTDTFLVCNGDIFTDLDLGQVLRFHRERGARATIALTPVEDPTAFGLVETGPDGRVLRFLEKPSPQEVTTNWVNAGTYVLEPEVLAFIPPGEPYMFERGLFPRLLEEGVPIYGYPSRAYWLDLGTPANYLKLHRDLLLSGRASLGPATPQGPGLWAEEGCRVDPGVRVRGPVLLGRGCVVERGAALLGPLCLGPGCRVEEGATLQSAVLWEGARVSRGARVADAILGRGAQVGPAALVQGCILADGVVVGEGNRLERGLALWPGTSLPPGAVNFVDLA